MQTPQRKPDKYAEKKQDPHISLNKYKELEANLERLINAVRPKLIKEVRFLAQDGDFSENAAYSIAKGRLRGTNSRIEKIKDMLKRAIVIDTKKISSSAQIGSQINVKVNGKNKAFQILGPAEADPTRGIISHLSPLGKILIGKKSGDTVELNLKNKKIKYKIIKIF